METTEKEPLRTVPYHGARLMTVREQFAAMALQGLLAKHGTVSLIEDTVVDCADLAKDAVRAADALIAELNK